MLEGTDSNVLNNLLQYLFGSEGKFSLQRNAFPSLKSREALGGFKLCLVTSLPLLQALKNPPPHSAILAEAGGSSEPSGKTVQKAKSAPYPYEAKF